MNYECQWISDLPGHECGGGDFDRATYGARDFKTAEKARTFARAILPGFPVGSVLIREYRLRPLWKGAELMGKEYIGEAEEIS